MAVPEAAVSEKHGPIAWKHDIRLSRQPTVMEPEAET